MWKYTRKHVKEIVTEKTKTIKQFQIYRLKKTEKTNICFLI